MITVNNDKVTAVLELMAGLNIMEYKALIKAQKEWQKSFKAREKARIDAEVNVILTEALEISESEKEKIFVTVAAPANSGYETVTGYLKAVRATGFTIVTETLRNSKGTGPRSLPRTFDQWIDFAEAADVALPPVDSDVATDTVVDTNS